MVSNQCVRTVAQLNNARSRPRGRSGLGAGVASAGVGSSARPVAVLLIALTVPTLAQADLPGRAYPNLPSIANPQPEPHTCPSISTGSLLTEASCACGF